MKGLIVERPYSVFSDILLWLDALHGGVKDEVVYMKWGTDLPR